MGYGQHLAVAFIVVFTGNLSPADHTLTKAGSIRAADVPSSWQREKPGRFTNSLYNESPECEAIANALTRATNGTPRRSQFKGPKFNVATNAFVKRSATSTVFVSGITEAADLVSNYQSGRACHEVIAAVTGSKAFDPLLVSVSVTDITQNFVVHGDGLFASRSVYTIFRPPRNIEVWQDTVVIRVNRAVVMLHFLNKNKESPAMESITNRIVKRMRRAV